MVVDKIIYQQLNTLRKYFLQYPCTLYSFLVLCIWAFSFEVVVIFPQPINRRKITNYRISLQNLGSSWLKRNVIVNNSYMFPYYKGYFATLTQSLSDFGFDNDMFVGIEISHKVVLHSKVSSIAYRSLRTWMPYMFSENILSRSTSLVSLCCRGYNN